MRKRVVLKALDDALRLQQNADLGYANLEFALLVRGRIEGIQTAIEAVKAVKHFTLPVRFRRWRIP